MGKEEDLDGAGYCRELMRPGMTEITGCARTHNSHLQSEWRRRESDPCIFRALICMAGRASGCGSSVLSYLSCAMEWGDRSLLLSHWLDEVDGDGR